MHVKEKVCTASPIIVENSIASMLNWGSADLRRFDPPEWTLELQGLRYASSIGHLLFPLLVDNLAILHLLS